MKTAIMIAGAQKAGTTSLSRYLDAHPDVATHPALEFAHFIEGYKFETYEQAFARSFGSVTGSGKAVLAKSVGIMVLPDAARRLHDHNPDVKVITILREPVERAYSAYWYQQSVGRQSRGESFEEALASEERRLAEHFDVHHHTAYYWRGLYADQLRMLHEVFGHGQVRTLVLEEFLQDPKGHLDALFDWLGLRSLALQPDLRAHNEGGRVRSQRLAAVMRSRTIRRLVAPVPPGLAVSAKNRLRSLNASAERIPPIDAKTAAELRSRYRRPNDDLYALLGRRIDSWEERA